jgi:hypothetical protein
MRGLRFGVHENLTDMILLHHHSSSHQSLYKNYSSSSPISSVLVLTKRQMQRARLYPALGKRSVEAKYIGRLCLPRSWEVSITRKAADGYSNCIWHMVGTARRKLTAHYPRWPTPIDDSILNAENENASLLEQTKMPQVQKTPTT